jgi:hypothetical protein
MAVIPAKAGIHIALMQKRRWIPAFAGMTARKTGFFATNGTPESRKKNVGICQGANPNIAMVV